MKESYNNIGLINKISQIDLFGYYEYKLIHQLSLLINTPQIFFIFLFLYSSRAQTKGFISYGENNKHFTFKAGTNPHYTYQLCGKYLLKYQLTY